MTEEERRPQEWARELGVELHGMTDERWDAYLQYLEEKNEIADAGKRLLEEAKDLHAAFHADKFVRAQNQEQRRRLWGPLHELRIRRLAELRARYEALYPV
jgi:DnaJ-domain-containing protein 1